MNTNKLKQVIREVSSISQNSLAKDLGYSNPDYLKNFMRDKKNLSLQEQKVICEMLEQKLEALLKQIQDCKN